MTARFLRAPVLVLAGAACGSFAANTDVRVLTVGERAFTGPDFDRFVDSRIGLGATLDAPLLSALLDEFAREQLLLIGADEAGVRVSEIQLLAEIGALSRGPGTEAVRPDDGDLPETGAAAPDGEEAARFRSRVANRLRVDLLLETVVLAGLEASDEATRLEYEAGRAFYARPETITLSEQRFDDRDAAEAAAARVKSSEDDGAPTGRFIEIGSFRRGELPDAVDRAVFGLEPGDATGVIETAAGFRIFRVDRRLPPGSLDFEEVEDVARLTVLRREADARVEAFVGELRARHPITVHSAGLGFPYVGRLPRGE